MQAMQAVQAVQAMQAIPVMPTKESQADKQITHPIWSCVICKIDWRSHVLPLCPECACQVGTRFVLNEEQVRELLEAVSHLGMNTFTYTHEMWELEMWSFLNLLQRHAKWYDMSSRRIIQACYEALRVNNQHSKTTLAISFFEEQYVYASDEENTFCPTVRPNFQVDVSHDL